MISMVFSRLFFLNNEAFVNRGIPLAQVLLPLLLLPPLLLLLSILTTDSLSRLAQSLHQRRYWESFFWHPTTTDAQFVV